MKEWNTFWEYNGDPRSFPPAMVDRIATLKARIAELSKEEKLLTAELKDMGADTYEGTEHYIVISEATRGVLDMKAVRKKLSRQFIKAHTTLKTSLSARVYGYSERRAA